MVVQRLFVVIRRYGPPYARTCRSRRSRIGRLTGRS